jgi:hypothetical protein
MLHAYFYTICLVFRYTLWYFYAFFWTNLLTRCHGASSLFSGMFVFQKSYTGNILRIGRKQKPNIQILNEASRTPKRRQKGARRWPHHQGARPKAWPRRPMVSPTWSTSDVAPLPIKTSRREKPKHLINFLETHRDSPPSSTRDRKGPKALPSTLPERGIATEGPLHRHACLRRDEWVVYLRLLVHTSS